MPKHLEETDPRFYHYDQADLPLLVDEGKSVRLIAGSLYGQSSPVKTATEMFYADAALESGAKLPMPADHEERGIYVVEGSIEIAGDVFEAGRLLVFRPGDQITVIGRKHARIMLFRFPLARAL